MSSCRRISRFVLLGACFSLALSLISTRAQAQEPNCAFSASNISFGTVDLKNGSPYDAAGTFTYACTGDAREIIRICPSWGLAAGDTRFLTNSAGDKLIYNLYTDPDRNTVWGTWYNKNVKAPSIDVPMGRSERTSGTIQVYGRIAANQQSLPSGTYSGVINKSNAAITYGYASKGTCEFLKNGPKVSVGPSITATVRGGDAGPGAITAPDATKPHADAQPINAQPQDQNAEKKSVWKKLAENAQYQQDKQNRDAARNAHSDDSSDDDQQKQDRAKYIESHSCMTTDGADKANALADDCNKATSSPHTGCNIQENTCDEIRKATQKGCWGKGASAPDFCLTKYR